LKPPGFWGGERCWNVPRNGSLVCPPCQLLHGTPHYFSCKQKSHISNVSHFVITPRQCSLIKVSHCTIVLLIPFAEVRGNAFSNMFRCVTRRPRHISRVVRRDVIRKCSQFQLSGNATCEDRRAVWQRAKIGRGCPSIPRSTPIRMLSARFLELI
jgi:hypothetical protein